MTMLTTRPGPRQAGATSGWKPVRGLRPYALPGTGLVAAALTSAGMSGVGDAPDPHDAPAVMSRHFVQVRDEVLVGAGFGLIAAVLLAAFGLGVGRRLWAAGAPLAALAVAAGTVADALYFSGLHLVYTSLSAHVALTSPEATKALFTLTIQASPAFGAATSVALAAAAVGVRRTRLLPTWWVLLTAAAASVAAMAVPAQATSGWFSPDVQQQVVGNVVLCWLMITAIALWRAGRRSLAAPGRIED